MPDWLTNWFADRPWNWSTVLWSLGILITGIVLSNLAAAIVVVRLPANYFAKSAPPSFLAVRHPALAWSLRIAKNGLGAITIISGIVLSLPGIPGPGLLLILIGVTLLDFPGKRQLERRIVMQPRVLRTVNSIRAYFGRSPLQLD